MRYRAGLICSWGVHVARHVASNGRKLTPTNHDREAAEAVRGVVPSCGRLVARDQRRVRFAGDRGLAGDRGRGGGRCQLLTTSTSRNTASDAEKPTSSLPPSSSRRSLY